MSERFLKEFYLTITENEEEAILKHFREIPDKHRPVIFEFYDAGFYYPSGKKSVCFLVECGEHDDTAVKRDFNRALGREYFTMSCL